MCCCCPPAITALFCLWVKSGFSKGSVAGALTFFPPEPALYKFQRTSKDGETLPEEEDDESVIDDEYDEDDDEVLSDEDDDELGDPLELSEDEFNDDNGARTKKKASSGQSSSNGNGGSDEENATKKKKSQSPATALTERTKRLKRKAHRRNARDAKDAAAGVTYVFVPDPRLTEPPSFSGTVSAVKIGPHKKTKAYIATLIYRVRSDRRTERTKTIIYSHGNATDVGAMNILQCIIARSLNVDVVMYDYSGYGESGGVPLEKNTYRDVKTVYRYTVKHVAEGQDEGNVILYGQSVGSGPSCYLASRREAVGGLILHSPFTSGMRVLTPSRALACLDIFPNIDRIKKVRCPVMVIHGRLDEEVGVEHGMALHNAVPAPYKRDPWWVPDRGHNDITDGPGKMSEYIRRLRIFLDSLD